MMNAEFLLNRKRENQKTIFLEIDGVKQPFVIREPDGDELIELEERYSDGDGNINRKAEYMRHVVAEYTVEPNFKDQSLREQIDPEPIEIVKRLLKYGEYVALFTEIQKFGGLGTKFTDDIKNS